jgi:hypothetical protein
MENNSMQRLNARPVSKATGFGKVMTGLKEQQAREEASKFITMRGDTTMRLKEKFEKASGLGFGKGKLDEMFEKNPHKAENLVLFLEATERSAMENTQLVDNMKKVQSLKESRLNEDLQTSSFLGVTPQDIVKVARIAYPNSVSPEMFDFWGMSSMKDSIYKLETTYGGTTMRGATGSSVIYENYNDGRYPSSYEEEVVSVTATTAFTGTLDYYPLLPFQVQVFLNDAQVAIDNGSGVFTGTLLNSGASNVVNYSTGVFTITFTSALASTDSLIIRYAYNTEDSTLFSRLGSVLLNLVVYDYRAIPYPIAVEWTRFTEELMQSKLGMSAKESLIAGAADLFRKSLDEFCVDKAIKASNWTTATTFDTDFAAAGSDSSTAHAQGLLQAIMTAEGKTYTQLGREADKTNILVDKPALIYFTKHKMFNAINPSSKIGIYKAGELMGRDIYVAPPNVVGSESGKGKAYLFGKSNDTMNVDSVVSVGTWKAGLTTDPVELKNFNSQMGLAAYLDVRTNNRYFATKLELSNLTANS